LRDPLVRALAEHDPSLAGADVKTRGLVDDKDFVLGREQPAQ
jgi:hypothetical protein